MLELIVALIIFGTFLAVIPWAVLTVAAVSLGIVTAFILSGVAAMAIVWRVSIWWGDRRDD